ncbi:MAG TPA: hypothetical protein VL335_00090 [Candidatus Paceibacterota bacterium]|nr:hypothetical protein [Candidatus Paceibacterota bacterium]
MNLFSRTPKDSLNFIVDVQSSVVRGSLVLMRAGQLPHIVWTHDVDIAYRTNSKSAFLIDTAVKALKAISTEAHTFVRDTKAHPDIPNHISRVHCVLSSPWIVSQARTVSQRFDVDTKIGRSHISDVIKNERTQLAQNSDDLMIGIEEKIFDVRLNGYSIAHWENATARTLEVSFAISLAGKHMIGRFVDACKSAGVSGSHVDFHSSLLLQHIALNDNFASHDTHVLVHVHGELTDIVVASGQTCVLFGSHPIGVRGIVRKLSHQLKITESTSDSLLAMYENNQLDPIHGAHDIEIIHKILDAWTDSCLKVTSLVPTNHQPTRALISARFHETLFKNTFAAAYPTMQVELLPSEKLFELATFDPTVSRLRLTVLYTVAIHSLEIFQ